MIGFSFSIENTDSIDDPKLYAYITNFKELSDPPYLIDVNDLREWIDIIKNIVLELPSTPDDLLSSLERGHIGPFDAHHFLASSPKANELINLLKAS